MAASRPGNMDRGWNDPPMFDYQGSVTAGHMGTGSPQHTKLNKRVAYPMSSPTVSASPASTSPLLNPSEGPPRLPPIQILPPVSTTSTPTPVPVLIPTLSPSADSAQQPAIFSPPDSVVAGSTGGAASKVKVLDLPELLASLSLESEESLLQFVKDGFASALESVKDTVQARTVEDVKKKLGLMEECWLAGKITPPVKSQLGTLVSALKKDEMYEANELHLALMINHTAELLKWRLERKYYNAQLMPSDTGCIMWLPVMRKERWGWGPLIFEVHHWLVGVKRIIQELHSKETQEHSQSEDAAEDPVTDPCMDVPLQTVPLCMPLEATGSVTQDASEGHTPEDEADKNTEESVAGSS